MDINEGNRTPSSRGSRVSILLIGGCLSLSVAVSVFYVLYGRSPDSGSSVARESAQNEDNVLREQVQQLSQQVQILRAQQASSRIKLNAVAGQNGDIDSSGAAGQSSENSRQSDPEAMPPELTPEEEMARTQQRYDFLDEAFRSEERDPSWSSDTEDSIATAFQTESLANVALQSASCSSSMCKIEVRLARTDDLEYQDFQITFTSTLQSFLPRGTMRKVEQDDGSALGTAYLARPTARLPIWNPPKE